MARLLTVVAFALLILWQGECLTLSNGVLSNRCGVWQVVTGRPLILVTRAPVPQSAPLAPITITKEFYGAGGGGVVTYKKLPYGSITSITIPYSSSAMTLRGRHD